MQVAGVQLKSGGRLEGSVVLVGVGARPNVELFKGQLDLLEKAPGGIKVDGRLQVGAVGRVGCGVVKSGCSYNTCSLSAGCGAVETIVVAVWGTELHMLHKLCWATAVV